MGTRYLYFLLFLYQISIVNSFCRTAFYASSLISGNCHHCNALEIYHLSRHVQSAVINLAGATTRVDQTTTSHEEVSMQQQQPIEHHLEDSSMEKNVDTTTDFVSSLFSLHKRCLFLPLKKKIEISHDHSSVFASAAIIGNPKAIFRVFCSTVGSLVTLILRELQTLTGNQKMLFVVTLLFGFSLGRVRPFWQRFTHVNDIPTSYIAKPQPKDSRQRRKRRNGRVLKGRAVSVTDGDTIRFLHQPTLFHPATIRKEKKEKMSEIALPIRLCTIDTPETPKFGKSGQPFGIEAKEHLKGLVEGKAVQIRILQTDQYGRAVAEVSIPGGKFPFLPRKYMDREMLQTGFAEVYQGGGAVYGPEGKEKYLELEDEAKKKKIGIWSQKNRESAADYKKRTKK